MELELERFWKVVRPKRYPPRPKAAQRPKTIQIYIEAVESPHGDPCTGLVGVTLSEASGGYQGKVHFGAMTSEVTINGFRWYTNPGDRSFFMRYEPLHLGPDNDLVLTLYVGDDGEVMSQIRSAGLLD